jgi:catalase
LTTASEGPYVENENSESVGVRRPSFVAGLYSSRENGAFQQERLPERVVYARFGRFGTFTVTHDISKYTKAKMFSEIGKETKVLVRFSTVGGERICGNRESPRGFAIKFLYGRWELGSCG